MFTLPQTLGATSIVRNWDTCNQNRDFRAYQCFCCPLQYTGCCLTRFLRSNDCCKTKPRSTLLQLRTGWKGNTTNNLKLWYNKRVTVHRHGSSMPPLNNQITYRPPKTQQKLSFRYQNEYHGERPRKLPFHNVNNNGNPQNLTLTNSYLKFHEITVLNKCNLKQKDNTYLSSLICQHFSLLYLF